MGKIEAVMGLDLKGQFKHLKVRLKRVLESGLTSGCSEELLGIQRDFSQFVMAAVNHGTGSHLSKPQITQEETDKFAEKLAAAFRAAGIQ